MTSKTDIRLSQSARVEAPAWHPQGHGLLAVQQSKGTQNLVWASLPDSTNWNEQIAQQSNQIALKSYLMSGKMDLF